MSTQIDWSRELDDAIPHAPDRVPGDYVAAGRAAVRRRRVAVAIASAAVVAVGAGLVWSAMPGSEPTRADAPVATQGARPTPTPTPTVTPTTAPSAKATRAPEPGRAGDPRTATAAEMKLLGGPHGSLLAAYTPAGDLVVSPGWRLTDFLDNPFGTAPPGASAGLELTRGDQVRWAWTERTSTGSSASSVPAHRQFAHFGDWLANEVAVRQGDEGPRPAWLIDGMVATAPGVEVLEVVEHPAEAAGYAPPRQLAAAMLRLSDDSLAFALVTPEGSMLVEPEVLEAPTMAAFLRHLAEHIGDGEGLG